jgi:hypothetical protein
LCYYNKETKRIILSGEVPPLSFQELEGERVVKETMMNIVGKIYRDPLNINHLNISTKDQPWLVSIGGN